MKCLDQSITPAHPELADYTAVTVAKVKHRADETKIRLA